MDQIIFGLIVRIKDRNVTIFEVDECCRSDYESVPSGGGGGGSIWQRRRHQGHLLTAAHRE